MKKENKNFLYNAFYQIFLYIFPLIIIPYISRTLGVRNIGVYSYTYSIVTYFMLFSMLGINNYGNREISKVRDNKKQLSKTFSSIYYLQLIITLLMCLSYIIFLIFFCKEYKLVFLIQFLSLLSVCFDINWLFFGLEKFKITIIRNFFIKLFSLILILIFVKSKSDLWVYTLISSSSILFSQLYLFYKSRNIVKFEKISFKEIFKHFKNCLILFIPVLAYGVYRIMDKTMLGSISSVIELGYYDNSEKLINIPIGIITALGTVMLPHMSYLFKKDGEEYKNKIYDSMKLVLILSVSMAFGLFLVSEDISIVLFGSEYIKSGGIIKLLSITIIASAWANVIRTQFLIPKSKDNIYIFSTIGGAVINLILNLIFIKKYGAYGACIGTICAEFFVMIYQTISTKKYLEFNRYFKILINCILNSIIMVGLAFILTYKIETSSLRLFSQIIICIIVFLIIYYKYIIYEFLGFKKN